MVQVVIPGLHHVKKRTDMNKVKGKITGKVSTTKGKPIKPKLGRGTGGLFTAKIVVHAQKEDKKSNKKQ